MVNRFVFRSKTISLRYPDTPISLEAHVVLGIATYAPRELDLISELDCPDNTLKIEVFDVLDCKEMKDFESFMPGIGEVYQTPVFGLFIHGILTETATGLANVKKALYNLLD